MNKYKAQILAVGAVMVTAGLAAAQPGDGATAAAADGGRHHSVNVNPMGFLGGAYNVNYEHLGGSHGLLVEAAFEHHGSDDASVTSYGAGAGWRWHWRGRQNSGFVGAMLGFSGGTAQATVGTDMPTRYDLSVKALSATVNLGKRWQLDNGLNVTFRLGAGWAKRWVSTSSADPEAQQAVADVEDLLALLPIAIDGELSLGYSF